MQPMIKRERRQGQTASIFTDAQVAAWKAVTDAVHGAGGRMVLQLWLYGLEDARAGVIALAAGRAEPAHHV
jgi:2,4-dienoyl-CoA reductase-like NADH-dependent reductase (Old Yellow Enzyme family)